jgi:hypothetical protein
LGASHCLKHDHITANKSSDERHVLAEAEIEGDTRSRGGRGQQQEMKRKTRRRMFGMTNSGRKRSGKIPVKTRTAVERTGSRTRGPRGAGTNEIAQRRERRDISLADMFETHSRGGDNSPCGHCRAYLQRSREYPTKR